MKQKLAFKIILRTKYFRLGYGIGSFLGGLFRCVLPLIKKGSIAAGKEILTQTSNFIDDVQHNKSVKHALKQRASETVSNLKRRAMNSMSGNGYIASKKLKSSHLLKSQRVAQTKIKLNRNRIKKPKKEKKTDIFSE